MFNIDKIIQCAASISSSSSNTSSTLPCRPNLTHQESTLLEVHAPPFPPPFYHPMLPPQQQPQHFYESHSQLLSRDEWALIVSLRKMSNLSVSTPLEPTLSSLVHPESVNVTSQSSSSSDLTDRQIELLTHYATEPVYIRPYAPSTTSQQLLTSRQIKYPSTQSQQLFSFAASQPLTISPNRNSEQISLHLQTPSPQQVSSPLQTESGHQKHSHMVQIQSNPSPPVSPPAIILPAQKQQQNASDRSASSSPHQYQSTYLQTPVTFHYNPTITGPIVQLLDPTKPYELGDTVKIGRRILKSDALSMKYWCEDDITLSETITGGYMLNMAGFSYFVKHYGKNFTTWECEYRRKQGCSSVVIRSSDPTVNNYFRIYSIQGEHIHESAPNNIELRKFKYRIRERCKQELSSPRTIYEDELKKGKYSSEMLAILPTFYNMRK